jgi:hypothetical protein
MKTLTIEMDRGQGWEVRAEGKISANTTTASITQDLRAYAIQYPHRAPIDGVEVARVIARGGATLR